MRSGYAASTLGLCRHSLSTKIAPRTTTSFAGLEAVADLHSAVLLDSELHFATPEQHRLFSSHTATSPSRITASTGTAGEGSSTPVTILKLANISDFSAPSVRHLRTHDDAARREVGRGRMAVTRA
jgi:hypothetical protein